MLSFADYFEDLRATHPGKIEVHPWDFVRALGSTAKKKTVQNQVVAGSFPFPLTRRRTVNLREAAAFLASQQQFPRERGNATKPPAKSAKEAWTEGSSRSPLPPSPKRRGRPTKEQQFVQQRQPGGSQ